MRKVTVAAIVIATSMFVGSIAYADAQPDPTFSGDGVTYFDPDGVNWFEDVVAVNGGYLVSGPRARRTMQVAKYADDGSRVRSFGQRGVASVDVGTRYPYESQLALLPDGRIVLAFGTGQHGFAVAVLRRDGELSKPFGKGGVVKRAFEPSLNIRLEIDYRGRIVVVAGEREDTGKIKIHAWRFHADGRADKSFDGGDVVAAPQKVNDVAAFSLDDRGRLYVVTMQSDWWAGTTGGMSLVRISEDGRRVKTLRRISVWNHDGTWPVGIDQKPNGTMLVGVTGSTTARVGVLAFRQSGRTAHSFGSNGVTTQRCADTCYVFGQALDRQGGITLFGGVGDPTATNPVKDSWAARFASNGQPDATFIGGDWQHTFAMSDSGRDAAYGAMVDDLGRLVMVGSVDGDAYVMRLTSS
jgi:hypothetical protein